MFNLNAAEFRVKMKKYVERQNIIFFFPLFVGLEKTVFCIHFVIKTFKIFPTLLGCNPALLCNNPWL